MKSPKQKRMAKHITRSEENAGKSPRKAKKIAYAVVNKRKKRR